MALIDLQPYKRNGDVNDVKSEKNWTGEVKNAMGEPVLDQGIDTAEALGVEFRSKLG